MRGDGIDARCGDLRVIMRGALRVACAVCHSSLFVLVKAALTARVVVAHAQG